MIYFSIDFSQWLYLTVIFLCLALFAGRKFLFFLSFSAFGVGLIGLMARPFFAMFEHPIVQGLIYIVLLVLLSVLSPPFSKRRALKILHVGQVISLPCPLKKGQAVVSLQGKVWTLYGPDLRKGQMVKIVHMSKDDIYVKPEGETANEC